MLLSIRRFLLWLPVAVILLASAGAGGAPIAQAAVHRTYFVSSGGSDAVACAANGSAAPFQTIERAGIHAASTEQLPQWLGDEMWEIDLGGQVLTEEPALVASQARLRRRIDAWDEATRRRFAETCLARARDRRGVPAGAGARGED